jgi:ATP-dependent metalloprotease
VDETFGTTALRWIKFLLWFGLCAYLSLVIITMVFESMTTFKRPGSKLDTTEAKAENQKARFNDVHGCDEAKEELQELVDFLRNPDKFSNLGGKLPKGVLLVGPPGTGKTLLARAVAGEAGVPFFFMSGSEFDEVYVGVGAKRVRDLFNAAKAKAPSIVFIDELDAIGGKRNSRDATYVRQTLNQLLTEMDGFAQNSGVIILAATNFPESLDKALTRPGRFDRHVVVSLPDVRGRIAILKHHAQKIKMGTDVNIEAIASRTSGLSGAELENIVNQAAVHASKTKAKSVMQTHFEWAKDKVIMGAEKRSMVITPKEKEMTAYHEAGHALVAYYSKDSSGELYKVTVLPRGQSLGHTAFLPEMDKYSYTVRDYLGRIDRAMGGKVAEEIVYGNELVTSGVSAVCRRLPFTLQSHLLTEIRIWTAPPARRGRWSPSSACLNALAPSSISASTTSLAPRRAPWSSPKSRRCSTNRTPAPARCCFRGGRNSTCLRRRWSSTRRLTATRSRRSYEARSYRAVFLSPPGPWPCPSLSSL